MANWLTALASGVILTIPAVQSSAEALDPNNLTGSFEPFEAIDPPREMPKLSFVDADGRKLDLGDFAGRVVLLNLWATWCAPCVREMPDLDQMQALRGGEDFVVLALSFDRKGVPQVERFYEQRGIEHLGIYVDDNMRSFRAIAAPALPTSFILDRQGRAVGILAGPAEWSSDQALALVDHYLGLLGASAPQEAADAPAN